MQFSQLNERYKTGDVEATGTGTALDNKGVKRLYNRIQKRYQRSTQKRPATLKQYLRAAKLADIQRANKK